MYIETIELKNFRNYDTLSLALDAGTNILYGNNAQGKTNILEAAYLCGTTKSHRGSRDKDMIRFGEEEAHIRMVVRRQDVPYRIDMHLKKSRAKGIAVNEVPIKRPAICLASLILSAFRRRISVWSRTVRQKGVIF